MNEIAYYIEHDVNAVREDVVKMVAGIPVKVKLNGYSAVEQQLNTRDKILSAMVVFGFLAYHNGMLKIPNHEIMEKFESVLKSESFGGIKDIVIRSKEMLEAVYEEDVEKTADILEYVHDREIPFLVYNDENALSCVVTLCFLYAREDYYIEREAKAGKGYGDYIFLPKKRNVLAIILELKVDDTCENALKQIKERRYAEKVIDYAEQVILVGIAYNKKESSKSHQCVS